VERPTRAGTVESVIARLPGTNGTDALLLVAHYDSVATGLGASDNGSGVATLLETLRALRGGPPLRNDVIFAFTDGEEDGGLGAQAFVDEYSPAKLVTVALVVDSGGSCGRAPLVVESLHQQNECNNSASDLGTGSGAFLEANATQNPSRRARVSGFSRLWGYPRRVASF
jgi:Zn-dependent M28 family amino/carboxypeptidase